MGGSWEIDMEKALHIALDAHAGQRDSYGSPLILHPLRMMMRLSGQEERITALLHDVVEKSGWTLEDLRRQGFAEAVITAVDLLSRRGNERYEDYLERLTSDGLAVRVKLADLEDHMDPSRAAALTPEVLSRMKKSHASWLFLKKHLASENASGKDRQGD